jgi:predicted nucleotidyltransferase
MTREQVLTRLLEHKAELQSLGLSHLRLFGSVARAENTASSDVDLLAEFDPEFSLTLITLGRAQTRLERLLGCRVDLATEAWLRPIVRERAAKESLIAF